MENLNYWVCFNLSFIRRTDLNSGSFPAFLGQTCERWDPALAWRRPRRWTFQRPAAGSELRSPALRSLLVRSPVLRVFRRPAPGSGRRRPPPPSAGGQLWSPRRRTFSGDTQGLESQRKSVKGGWRGAGALYWGRWWPAAGEASLWAAVCWRWGIWTGSRARLSLGRSRTWGGPWLQHASSLPSGGEEERWK